MWSPTHIQVTVQRARGLLLKGKNGTNNCFVTIGLGKEKYQTSCKEKAAKDVDWHEECELTIPDQGNRAELVLTCLHRNNIGIDEFLGQVTLPLNEMDVYERPRSKWYKLESKPGKEKKKDRGEIEVRITFIVKSGSLTDLRKKEKHKSSVSQLAASVGGSLLSLGSVEKKKGIKKFAKSLSSKVLPHKKKDIKDSDSDFSGSFSSVNTSNSFIQQNQKYGQTKGDADPGVISEDDDEFVFENLSHKSSGSSLNINKNNQVTSSPVFKKEDISFRSRTLPPLKPMSGGTDPQLDEWEKKLYGKSLEIGSSDSLKRRSWETSRLLHSTKEVSEVEEQLPKNKTIIEDEQQSNDSTVNVATEKKIESLQSNTAPTSPVSEIKDNSSNHSPQKEMFNAPVQQQPATLPRSNTTGNLLESINKESEKERTDKLERKRFAKLKYFRKDKHDNLNDSGKVNQFRERIIVGHENHILKAGDKIEISKEILKKYEGKSREEVILIANGLESEVYSQRQKVKELEDYLDNLLLRVMETHPKILQNPYDRNISTKSG